MEPAEIPLEAGYSKSATVTLTAIVHPALCAYRVRIERVVHDDDGLWLEDISEEYPTYERALEAYETACREAVQFELWEQELADGV